MRGYLRFAYMVCAVAFECAVAGPALGLPAERHYEMVSPVFKGGFGTPGQSIQAVPQEEGGKPEAVGFYSPGSFAGSPGAFFLGPDYLARRTPTGWSTTPLSAPADLIGARDAFDLTPSLDLSLMIGSPGSSSLHLANEADFLLHETEAPNVDANWELAASVSALAEGNPTIPLYEAASENFCHMVIIDRGSEPLLPSVVGDTADTVVYDVSRGCGGAPSSLSAVGVKNKVDSKGEGELIDRVCDTRFGAEGYAAQAHASEYHAISADGSEIFFTVCTKDVPGERFGHQVPHQLFVRLAGSKTVEVSRPLAPACEAKNVPGEVPCAGAESRGSADFQGASEDGSRVYFTAPLNPGQSPLVPGDTDESTNLYVATIGCPEANPECNAAEREVTSLEEVSHDPSEGQAANVLGVVAIAPDGSHAYFVASGDLLDKAQRETLESEGRPLPQAGADNLYAYSPSTGVAFIGDVCFGQELSGAVEDLHCPSSGSDEKLWDHEEAQAQTAGTDGRFLVFATYAQLNGGDRNQARDVYRYDAATGQLNRVSLGENGYDDNGNHTVLGQNGEALGAQIMPTISSGLLLNEDGLRNRAVSEDGSRVVFRSGEPLSPDAASNPLEKVYEWQEDAVGGEGHVSLVSNGSSASPVEDAVISPSGTSIYFVTVDGLASQDTDGLPDVYDARLGEGFPQSSSNEQPCEGDGCQGPLTNPAPLLVPGSVSQAPGGNFAVPAHSLKAKKSKPKSRHKKKRKHKKRAKKASVRRRQGDRTKGRGRE